MPTTWMDTVVRQSRRLGTSAFPHQAAFILDLPMRRILERPDRLAEALGLGGGEQVLELGPGPGFFSVEVAQRLTGGRLHLFDLQPEMLAKARRKLQRAGFTDVGYDSGDAGAGLPYPDATFDVAFLASVIGEVPDKAACLGALARVMKPGSLLVFREAFPDPDRVSEEQLRQLAEPAGFAFHDATGSRWQDIVRFERLR